MLTAVSPATSLSRQTCNIEHIKYLLVLLHALGSNTQAVYQALSLFKDYETLLYAVRSDAEHLVACGISSEKVNAIKHPDWEVIERELTWAHCSGNTDNNGREEQQHIIGITDVAYPPLLREIFNPPIVLFVKGDKTILRRPQLAIVGSRNPTPLGTENAYAFANQAAQLGFIVTSGLAVGIDASAHRGALAATSFVQATSKAADEVTSRTIAVMGTGLDHIYPKQHARLAQEIIARGGALVSEFPLHVAPLAANFPQRNRIISGLSLGTLVVEATLRSGSLITARLAAEQGREVFAIPSSIHNPFAHGCHALIKQGAKLVESISDVIEELPPLEHCSPQTNIGEKANAPLVGMGTICDATNDANDVVEVVNGAIKIGRAQENIMQEKMSLQHQELLACMSYEATPLDVLATRSNLTIQKIASMLLPLELQGYVQRSQGGYLLCTVKK